MMQLNDRETDFAEMEEWLKANPVSVLIIPLV